MPETGKIDIVPQASINLIDETFDISQSESYRLFIQTGPGGLSFCILNTVINKYIVLRHYPMVNAGNDDSPEVLKNIFAQDDLLGLKYKPGYRLLISPRSTLVPEHLFEANNATEYLTFNHGRKTDENVFYHKIHSIKAYNVFSCPSALTNLFGTNDTNASFIHHVVPFIEMFVAESSSSNKPNVAVYPYSDYMDIAVAKDKKLLFYNTFHIGAPEDAVYFLAGVSRLFDLTLASVKLFHAGSLKDASPSTELIRQYVDRIVECETLNTLTYSHYITDRLRAQFIHLFNLPLCVS